jgi:aspartyl-tRNA(Asn)/glutamyl-tRNA(Gln) amidotransferase subunit A
MARDDLCVQPLSAVSDLIRNRDVSPVEVTDAVLDRIGRLGPELNCYITVAAGEARRRAQELEELLRAGTYLGPLHGIPVSLKDNIPVAGVRTTAGSPILADWIPDANATVVNRLRESGAVIIAKANLYEFAYGAPHQLFGPTRNPWDLERSCGGSSSGSAAAVAGALCYGSLGTDTGGSIRMPACLCGIVGLRPTYGLVSRTGVIPVSYDLDTIGPMTRTVRDAALLLQGMAGHDPADPASSPVSPADYAGGLEDGVKGLRVGVVSLDHAGNVHPDVLRAVAAAYDTLKEEGAELREVELPDPKVATAVLWVIMAAEASDYHRTFLRTRAAEYHPVVRTWLERGEFIPATEYVHAQRVRQRLLRDLRRIFQDVDALALPGFPAPAYPIGATSVTIGEREVPLGDLGGHGTHGTLFSLTGRPAMIVPCGFSEDGLPLGLQLVGRTFDEATLFRLGRAYERASGWSQRQPASVQSASPS